MVVNTMWFSKKQDVSIIYNKYFNTTPGSHCCTGLYWVSVLTMLMICCYWCVHRWDVALMSGPQASRPKSHSLLWTIVLFLMPTLNASIIFKMPVRNIHCWTKSALSSIMLAGMSCQLCLCLIDSYLASIQVLNQSPLLSLQLPLPMLLWPLWKSMRTLRVSDWDW